MLETPLGLLEFRINGQATHEQLKELPNETQQFIVDKRYNIVFELSNYGENPVVLEGVLQPNQAVESGPSTGENLALIEFEAENHYLSVGFEGDIPGVKYEYFDDRIKITMQEKLEKPYVSALLIPSFIACNVAWVTTSNADKGRTDTWFAADPYYGEPQPRDKTGPLFES